jgi:coenzyme F420-dependent glucose-6-phosphate dehydrogenase
MLKFGYKASAEQFHPRQLLEFSVIAEQVGFDSVWVSDHFQPWRHQDGHAPFSMAWLAALGERTSRVTMGTSVATPTFRYHPSVVAQALATLDALNPHRMILGVGTGESINEVPATGMEWPKFRERFDRLQESIVLMRELWEQERVSFEGDYYQTRNATIYDRPSRSIPVYIAAAGPTASRLAGETGDGFICTSGKAPELYRDVLLPNVKQGLEKSGRKIDQLEKMIEMKVSFDPDPVCARNDTLHWAALALSAEEKTGIDDPVEMEKRANALSVERAASRWMVASQVDEHVEQIKPYIDLGFTHLVFHAPGPDQEKFLRLYADKVLPRLRSHFG